MRFEVGGAVESADEALDVRVDVINGGDVAATAVDVRGELGDEVDQVALPNGVPARRDAERAVPLRPRAARRASTSSACAWTTPRRRRPGGRR